MVAPLLTAIGIAGKLQADIDLDLDQGDPTQSTGKIDVSLKNAKLILSDPTLGLEDETFSKALFKSTLVGGVLTIDKSSGFRSEGLKVDMRGKITLKKRLMASQLDITINLELFKGLKDLLGFIVNFSTVRVKGTLQRPITETI
mgnify:CR=1 FL=1